MTAAQLVATAAGQDRLRPLQSCPSGRYADSLVVVGRGVTPGIGAHRRHDGRIAVRHRLHPRELDDELGGVLATALAPLTDDHRVFAHAFTGIVLTCHPDADRAWLDFYRNTLSRIGRADPGYSEIYRHALALLPGTSVLDLGCSLGFLSLHLAARGATVTACDLDPGTTTLLRHMATRLRRDVEVIRSAPGRVPVPSDSVDAVALLHVLEHVDDGQGRALIAEAVRIARHRVVVAVPYETTPTALFGHVRTLDPHALRALAACTPDWNNDVHEHHGGWLVLDRRPRPPR